MSSDTKRRCATRLALWRICRRQAFLAGLAIMVVFALAATGGSVLAQTASSTDAPPAAAQPAAPGAGHGFLIDKHVAHHVKCAACHAEKPPAEAPASAACVSCHQDVTTDRGPQPNPHYTHHGNLGDVPCESCHHVHKESVVACNTCHNFDMKAP